jgi:hypothetical protein
VGNDAGSPHVRVTGETRPRKVDRTTGPVVGKEKADVNVTLAHRLSAADRCDRCGAQAYIRARLASGGELYFCAHHGRAHLASLQAQASEIHDESDRLVADAHEDATLR